MTITSSSFAGSFSLQPLAYFVTSRRGFRSLTARWVAYSLPWREGRRFRLASQQLPFSLGQWGSEIRGVSGSAWRPNGMVRTTERG